MEKHCKLDLLEDMHPTLKLSNSLLIRMNWGKFTYAKATCIRRLGNPGGWFSDIERSGGGPLIDLGVHVIDILLVFNGASEG